MFVVGVFVRFHAAGGEIDGAGGVVNVNHFLHVPRTLGDSVLQVAGVVVEVEVSPAVAFAPVNEVAAAVCGVQSVQFLIGVHALLDDGHNGVGAHGV